MTGTRTRDPFAALLPAGAERLPVAWRRLRIPGPPAAFALRADERAAAVPERFARRTIQLLECPEAAVGDRADASRADTASGSERLALIDKVSPHALFDLMVTEASAPHAMQGPRADADAVGRDCGRALWRLAREFVRFVGEPEVRRDFGLDGGEFALALNSDAHTGDRESVQALKRFHLHLMVWRAGELAPLRRHERLGDMTDARERRQCLDPLAFVGAELLGERLTSFPLGLPGARLLPADTAAVCAGARPLGALLQLPGWAALGDPGFEELIRRLHCFLEQTAAALRLALTGRSEQPPSWQRHPLLDGGPIAANLQALGLSAALRARLLRLAAALRGVSAAEGARLRRAPAAARQHCMTLNQPCYSLGLHGAITASGRAGTTPAVVLAIQPRLFSGIGGAGLTALRGIPSVRILRGQGSFCESEWQRRAAFQRGFAEHHAAALAAAPASAASVRCSPPRRFRGFSLGWV